MEIAKTAATVRLCFMAAVCIIVAATMPPVSGGRPVMTSARSIKKGAIKYAAGHIPKRPARHTVTVRHCYISCLRLMIVPKWVISR